MPKIDMLRIGFSVNSSSTHTIVVLPSDALVDDQKPLYPYAGELEGKMPKEIIDALQPAAHDFGWSFFTASDLSSKWEYAWIILRESLGLPDWLRYLIGRELLGGVPSDPDDGYIDHQSMFYLPVDYETGKTVDPEFAREFWAFMRRDDVAVLGGNDNTDEEHHLLSQSVWRFEIPWLMGRRSDAVARKDGDWWTLFSRGSGTSARLTFNENAAPFVKATTPMLVDLKITDKCDQECPFCYTNSTPDGGHADVHEIRWLTDALASMRVFEVAIGGGEPTLHPKLENILRNMRDSGIVPNLTTANLDGLTAEIVNLCGSVAYTVRDVASLRKLYDFCVKNDVSVKKVVANVPMGTVREYDLERILRDADTYNIRVVLLGYKPVGRGASYKYKAEYIEWLPALLKSESHYLIGLDTPLVEELRETDVLDDVPRLLTRAAVEGATSCYIDAVGGKIGPDSYHPDKMVPLSLEGRDMDTLASRITEAFAQF